MKGSRVPTTTSSHRALSHVPEVVSALVSGALTIGGLLALPLLDAAELDESIVSVSPVGAAWWMVLALIPVIGITNWLLIPFAAMGAIIAAIGIALTSPGKRGRAKAGLVLNGIVAVVATMRLGMFGGLL